MKRFALAWSWLVVVGLACSGGQGGPGDGGAGAGQTGGRGGSGARGGASGTTGVAGTTGTGGSGGTGTGGTIGTGGSGGSAGAGGAGGSSGGRGGASAGSGGAGGSGGSAGAGGAGGSSGGSGGAGGRGGAGGTGGTGGSGGSAGANGGTGGSGGSAGAKGGAGGSGGSAGANGGTGGSGGTGGLAGAGGSSGGSGGTGGSSGPVHVTSDRALPNVQIVAPLVAVDSQDTAVLISASAAGVEDPGPRIDWIPRQGSPRNATFANAVTPSAIAIDGSRNLWLAGQLYRAVSFGGPTLQPIDAGYYLVRLNPDGSHAFSKSVTRAATTFVHGMAADAQGNMYVVGERYSTGSPLTDNVFVTKFSSAGDELYNREFAAQDTAAWANDVAVAPDGTVFIVGTHNSPVQFGATLLTLPDTSIDSGFVAALNPDTGAPNWVMGFGGPDFDVGNSIEVTSTGALRVSGLVSGAATVGGVSVQAHANGSAFVAELTATGGANWVKVIAGEGIVFAADTNAAGHTFAVGYLQGAIKETFVADVAPDGSATLPLRVTIAYDSNGANFAAADRHGGVWITGDFKGTLDLGLGPLDAGGADTFGNFLAHLEP
jgi:hypothetical protein